VLRTCSLGTTTATKLTKKVPTEIAIKLKSKSKSKKQNACFFGNWQLYTILASKYKTRLLLNINTLQIIMIKYIACALLLCSQLVSFHVDGFSGLGGQRLTSNRAFSTRLQSTNEDQHQVVDDYRSGLHVSRADEKLEKEVSVVMKFGGSSLANAERIDHVAKLIARQVR